MMGGSVFFNSVTLNVTHITLYQVLRAFHVPHGVDEDYRNASLKANLPQAARNMDPRVNPVNEFVGFAKKGVAHASASMANMSQSMASMPSTLLPRVKSVVKAPLDKMFSVYVHQKKKSGGTEDEFGIEVIETDNEKSWKLVLQAADVSEVF